MRGQAGTGPAEEPRGRPGLGPRRARPGFARPGQAGKGLGREGVSPGPALRLATARPRARAVGRGGGFFSFFFLPRKWGLEAPSGGRGLRRARPGARGAGEGRARAAEVAQPPPLLRPSLKKGRGSRHFSSLKIKLSPPIPLPSLSPSGPSSLPAFKGGPWSAQASRCVGGGGFALPPAPRRRSPGPLPGRLAPRCGRAAAPRASRGAPQADTAPCWRAPVSLSRESWPAGSALPARPPPAVAAGRRSPSGARGSFSARFSGARLALAGAARFAAADSSPLRSSAVLLPLLKRATPGGRLRPGREPGVQAGLGGLCPPTSARVRRTKAGNVLAAAA